MSLHKVLIKSAEALEKVAAELESFKLPTPLPSKPVKTAADLASEARIGQLAKQAADKLLSVNLLTTQEKADQWARRVVKHEGALEELQKLASHIQVPRMGSVVVQTQPNLEKDAYAVFETRVRDVMSRLHQ